MANGNGEGHPEDHILQPPTADTGASRMAIGPEEGKVCIRFPEPRLWVAIDPPNAVLMAKHMIDCAVACGHKVTLQLPRREVSREKREALVARAMHVIRSTQEQHKSPATVARSLVDSILSAID